jgi:ATP-binding cassette, subfamily B, bacterial
MPAPAGGVFGTRAKRFFSYYRPYRRLLYTDLACAFAVSAITLILPLCVSHLTKNVLEGNRPESSINAPGQILLVAALMLALVAAHTGCNAFVDYQGHMMGTLMESDMRRDLFAQYQKLSFGFYDGQRTGQLMSRLTNDLYNIGEFAHHGPEDFAVAVLKFAGAFAILLSVNVQLTLVVFVLFPVMLLWALHFNQKMNWACGNASAT